MRSSPHASATIGRHTVGNALVLHARDLISAEAQSLALAVDADAENDIVVLDLHDDLPVGIWESVAGALPRRRRRGIRLVICGAGQDTVSLAGQWLSDRLGRSVLAPYGRMIRGAAGGLLVHTGEGSGWIRYSPGRPPARDAKRYPRPVWDDAAADSRSTSASGAVEPLPGGVWIRDTRDAALIAEHGERLAAALPCQPEWLTVVLGCPGTPPLPLDDVARFWRVLAEEDRARARFVQYGPVQLAPEETLGQALADLLDGPVVCFAGVPVGRPDQPQIHTVTPEGLLGWQVFARELGYAPREHPARPPRLPRILSYRAPAVLGDPVSPLIYRYAQDAVVEIVQAGLWIRGETAPGYAERIRARGADPLVHLVVVDDADPSRVTRYRALAADLVAQLDPATRVRSALQAASAVMDAGPVVRRPAGGRVPDALTVGFSAADLALDAVPDLVALPAGEPLSVVVPGPALEPVPEPAVTAPADPVPVDPVADQSSPDRIAVPLPRRAREAEEVRDPEPVLPSPPDAPAAAGPGTDGPGREVALVGPVDVPPPAGPSAAEPSPVRFQNTPDPDARALPTPAGLDAERAWLRESFSREYEAAAGSVARVFAAHPGFQPGPDTMVDAVAVRLYLSELGRGLDAALRTGVPGPQVPFGRCVAGGLARLPSHRGATVLCVQLTAAEVRAVERRQVLVDWGFTQALTEPPEILPGNVDVLIWSMTARRTRLLEPGGEHHATGRVVFMPGTCFKVLDAAEPGPWSRGHLLLRELSADEPDRDRVPFDDLASASLRRAAEQWAGSTLRGEVGGAAVDRFAALPGLA